MSRGRPYKGPLTEKDQANREILVNIRRQSGMTQSEFCEKVLRNRHTTPNSYRQYETGERRVPEWLLREVDMYFNNREGKEEVKDQITITKDEFFDLTATAFHVLTQTGKLAVSELDKYTDITAALAYMFTDEYANYRERRKQIEQYIKENPERDGEAQDGRGKGEA